MSRTQTFTADSSGERLDIFLSKQCPDLSRSRLQHLITDGCVTLDGAIAKPSSRLREGQLIDLTVPDAAQSHMEPQDIPLTVVYQDSDILVIDKQAGLTVHPAPGHPDQTLVNAVLALCPDLQGIGGTVRPGIVHRLDKDTSGLMVVAKNEKAHAKLTAQVKERSFTKLYIALAHGKVSPAEAVIEAAIGRDPGNRKRMAVVSNGREATTRYKILTYYKGYSLIEVKLITGRTHQIRVHFASIGHAAVGDEVYGRTKSTVARQFLHAHRLGFNLPSTGQYTEFESPLPQDLSSFLETVREGE